MGEGQEERGRGGERGGKRGRGLFIFQTDKTSSQAIKKYKKEVVRNRKLYNEIQELKGTSLTFLSPPLSSLTLLMQIPGNIRVYCRVRPLSHDEVARNDENVVSFPEENIMLVNNPQTNQKKSFEFEKIYNPDLHQGASLPLCPLSSSLFVYLY